MAARGFGLEPTRRAVALAGATLLFANPSWAQDRASADPRGGTASVHRLGKTFGDLPENIVSDGMPMKVVYGLEAVQIDQAQCERLPRFRCGCYPVGEEALKAAPVGQPGQIVGERYGHRRFSRLLGDALHFGDHEP